MRSSYLFKVCITLLYSTFAFQPLASNCSAQCSSCDSSGTVSASFGDGAQSADCGSAECGCQADGCGQSDCGCEGGGLFGRGRLRSNLSGRSSGAGSDCGCEGNGTRRSKLFLENPIPRGPASGIRLNKRGAQCNSDCQGCEECRGGLFSGIGLGRFRNGLAGRASNVGGRLRGLSGSDCENCGLDGCSGCDSGFGSGALAGRMQGGGFLNGGRLPGAGSRLQGAGLGGGHLAGLGSGCHGCASGCHGCTSGLMSRGLLAAKGIVGPARGDIPHTSQPPMGYGEGQQAPTYGYPYYTARAPRDFLMDNPPSIGW